MKARGQMLTALQNWFLALSRRERIMVASAAILAPAYLLISLGVMPALEEYQTLEKRLQTRQQENTALTRQISELGDALKASPNTRQRAEIERLEEQLADLHAEVGAHLDALIAPEQMPGILRRLLRRHPGITLHGIHNAAPQVIRAEAQNPTPENDPDPAAQNTKDSSHFSADAERLYRHPLLLELEGSYLDALAYLEKIRAWPEHMFIDSVEISTDEYPRNRILLQISSISPAASLLRGSSIPGESR
jgi:MSHA biogenesis protein MshJ